MKRALPLALLFAFLSACTLLPAQTPTVLTVGSTGFPTIQSAVSTGCQPGAVGQWQVLIPSSATPADTIAQVRGCTRTFITDQRITPTANCYWSTPSYLCSFGPQPPTPTPSGNVTPYPAGTAVFAYGDSIFAGYNNPTPATMNPPYLLAATNGWALSNYAYPGDTLVDMMLRVQWGTPITSSSLTFSNIGVNSQALICAMDNCSASTPPSTFHLEIFKEQLAAYLLYFGTPDSRKIKASQMTLTGSWHPLGGTGNPLPTYPTWSFYTGTQGDTATFQVYGTRVDVIASFETQNGYASTSNGYSMTVDGVAVPSVSNGTNFFPGGTPQTLSQNGGVLSIVDLAVKNLPNTFHTVVFTNNEATGTGTSLYWGQGSTPDLAPPVSLPQVYQALAERFARCSTDTHHSDAATSYFRTAQMAVVSDLISTAGLRVVATDIAGVDGYDPNNPAQMNTDCAHPNLAGATAAAAHLNRVVAKAANQ